MNPKKIILNVILVIIAFAMIAPMFWMLIISILENPLISDIFISISKKGFTLNNYFDIIDSDSFDRYFINSIIISGIITISNVFFCLMAGYALARWQSILSKIVLISVLSLLMIPPHVVMIPLYRLMVNLGWINSYFALIIPWIITPFGVFLVKQYIEKIPIEIENAARIDGASDYIILFKIIMPIAKPILIVLSIYTFLANWNTFLFPFLFTNTEEMRTLPVGLTFYLGKQSIDWGHLMAGASISALPVIFLYLLFRKKIISGLIAGSLKS